MDGYIQLPLSGDPWQVLTLDLAPDGEPLHARVELRFLPAPGRWFLSVRDLGSGELLVNMIPLVCSRGAPNDLLLPFRFLREGRGIGSLFCLRGTDEPATPDPAAGNLNEFVVLWGDTFDE